MERDELARRWKQAQLHAAADMAERAAQEQPQQQEEPAPAASSEPEAPTFAQIMGVKRHSDIGPGRGNTPEDRLRHYMGLK